MSRLNSTLNPVYHRGAISRIRTPPGVGPHLKISCPPQTHPLPQPMPPPLLQPIPPPLLQPKKFVGQRIRICWPIKKICWAADPNPLPQQTPDPLLQSIGITTGRIATNLRIPAPGWSKSERTGQKKSRSDQGTIKPARFFNTNGRRIFPRTRLASSKIQGLTLHASVSPGKPYL